MDLKWFWNYSDTSLKQAWSYFVLQDCTKHFPVLLRNTSIVQSTSQYYFVLQSLHKVLPTTTLYYKTCTQYFLVLLCTTKAPPNTTLYYKACTKYLPVLLCTTKLAQSTSQYYFLCYKSAQSTSQFEMGLKWLWHDSETRLKKAWKLLRTTQAGLKLVTLHTSHFTLSTPHFTPHFPFHTLVTLQTSHPHSTLFTSYSTLHTSHSTGDHVTLD